MSLGFVAAKNAVATAFQAIDSSIRLEIEFPGGRKSEADHVWACSRLQDWALLNVDTEDVPPLARATSTQIPVGERYIVFNIEGAARVIGGVDITGRRDAGVFGDRIHIAPSPAREAVGGPLLNPSGLVAGIIGGSTMPGARVTRLASSVSRALWSPATNEIAATPINLLPSPGSTSSTLQKLFDAGVLTPPLVPSPSFLFGGSTKSMPKKLDSTIDTGEFSHADQVAWIYSMWQKKEKEGKGAVSARIYDYRNQLVIDVVPKKVSLSENAPLRVAFDVPLKDLQLGLYRVDVLWNSQPAWRTFFKVMD
jgi:hypothetical protein